MLCTNTLADGTFYAAARAVRHANALSCLYVYKDACRSVVDASILRMLGVHSNHYDGNSQNVGACP